MTQPDELSGVLRPVAAARGLPNPHYISDEVFALERDRVLFAAWAGIGFAKDIPEPGDAMPVDFLGQPLVLVRNRDGAVKLFQNTCRHRGMILVEAEEARRGDPLPLPFLVLRARRPPRHTPHVGGPGHNTIPTSTATTSA